jgi:hypothetical protein
MIFHHEGEDITGLTTAKAMIKLLARMNGKGGSLLTMKGTTSQETRPRSFQVNALSYDLDDIGLFLDKGCY